MGPERAFADRYNTFLKNQTKKCEDGRKVKMETL